MEINYSLFISGLIPNMWVRIKLGGESESESEKECSST